MRHLSPTAHAELAERKQTPIPLGGRDGKKEGKEEESPWGCRVSPEARRRMRRSGGAASPPPENKRVFRRYTLRGRRRAYGKERRSKLLCLPARNWQLTAAGPSGLPAIDCFRLTCGSGGAPRSASDPRHARPLLAAGRVKMSCRARTGESTGGDCR